MLRDAIELRVGARLEVNVKLEIGSTDQSITITTEAEQLTTKSGQILLPADQRTTRCFPARTLHRLRPGSAR